MFAALLRYPWRDRRRVAQEWAARSRAVQAAARLARGPDADTLRRRALDDRRGTILRQGATYTAHGVTHWLVRHAVCGRTDQFELIANGKIVRTSGRRRLPKRFRPNQCPVAL
jgi:hypothetical protein